MNPQVAMKADIFDILATQQALQIQIQQLEEKKQAKLKELIAFQQAQAQVNKLAMDKQHQEMQNEVLKPTPKSE